MRQQVIGLGALGDEPFEREVHLRLAGREIAPGPVEAAEVGVEVAIAQEAQLGGDGFAIHRELEKDGTLADSGEKGGVTRHGQAKAHPARAGKP